jgi:hypothetical protein
MWAALHCFSVRGWGGICRIAARASTNATAVMMAVSAKERVAPTAALPFDLPDLQVCNQSHDLQQPHWRLILIENAGNAR